MKVLGGRSIVLVGNGNCENGNNIDVLVPGRNIVEHHIESIPRSPNLEISTPEDLPGKHASWALICRDRVHFSDEPNTYVSTCLKRDVPVPLLHNFLLGNKKRYIDSMAKNQFLSSFIILWKPSCPSIQKWTSYATFSIGMVIGFKRLHVPFIMVLD